MEYKSEKSADIIINDIQYYISIVEGPSHLSKNYAIIRAFDDNMMGNMDLEETIRSLKYYYKNPGYENVNKD